jgi:hypothetical protein
MDPAAPPAAPNHSSLQALSNAAFGRRSLPGRLRTPRTLMRAAGPKARKTLRRPRRSFGNGNRPRPGAKTRPGMDSRCCSAVGGGFLRRSPLAREAVPGVRRWRGEKRCRRRVFQGLRRSATGAAKRSRVGRRGCKPVRDIAAPKNPSSACRSGTRVDPRRIIFFT